MKLKALFISALIFFAAAPGFGAAPEGVDLSGPTAAELNTLAGKARAAGNNDLAIYYVRQALLRAPENIGWRLWLAQTLQKRGHDEMALEEAGKVLDRDPGNAGAAAVIAAIKKPKIVKSAEEMAKEQEDAAIEAVPFPEKSTVSLPKANGAWVFGDTTGAADRINTHNLAVPKEQQIYYFFIPGGELGIEGSKLSLKFDTAPAMALSDALAGDSMVMPVIHGLSRGSLKVTAAEWQRVGAEIAAKVEGDKRIAGVVFDIEPHVDVLHLLYASVKKGTQKPVLAIGPDRLTFKYVDAAILKCFNFGANFRDSGQSLADNRTGAIPDLGVYAGNVGSSAGVFMRNARAMGGKVFIGMPFSATTHEFEFSSASQDGPQTPSRVKMGDYVVNALLWTEHEVQVNDETFLGVAIWAIRPTGGVNIPPDPGWYFPSLISSELWERLKFPLIRR